MEAAAPVLAVEVAEAEAEVEVPVVVPELAGTVVPNAELVGRGAGIDNVVAPVPEEAAVVEVVVLASPAMEKLPVVE